jgi:hypothetical protein
VIQSLEKRGHLLFLSGLLWPVWPMDADLSNSELS